MPQKIKIKDVIGGSSSDHDDLMNCYFEETAPESGSYRFYDQHGNPIHTTPETLQGAGRTTSFTFNLDEDHWTISNFFVGHAAMGAWSNKENPAQDDGTFVAQAGGTTIAEPLEDASSASA